MKKNQGKIKNKTKGKGNREDIKGEGRNRKEKK